MDLAKVQKLLIVVDMVKGFITEGSMADRNIAHIVPELIKEIEKKEEGQEFVFIKDCHEKNSSEFASFPEHCVKGTSEAELIDELKVYENKALSVYEKNSTSAMFAKNFISDIDKMKKLKQVVITGCCTDICILNLAIPLKNYFNEVNKNIEIIVPKNMVETYNSDFHDKNEYNEMAFKLMFQAGIKVI